MCVCTGADLAVNPSASIAISLAQQGRSACKMDVEDPTCWRVSITGKVVPVAADKLEFAKKALFSRCVVALAAVSVIVRQSLRQSIETTHRLTHSTRHVDTDTQRWSTGRAATALWRT